MRILWSSEKVLTIKEHENILDELRRNLNNKYDGLRRDLKYKHKEEVSNLKKDILLLSNANDELVERLRKENTK